MKPIKALSILALIAGFTAPALAEPAPAKPAQGQIMAGPGDGAAGPLNAQENNSTYQQIQSPRDPASGQATGFREGGQNNTTYQKVGGTAQTGNALVYNESLTEARGTATAQPGQLMAGGLGGDGTGIRRDQPGQANNALVNNENIPWEARGTETANTGQFISGAGGDGTGIRRDQPGVNNALVYNESLQEARGTAIAQLGAPPQTCVIKKNCQEFEAVVASSGARGTETATTGQWIGGSDDGSSIRKPRPTKRSRKGRRMHKP